jgi:transposase-like protein
MSSTTVEHMAQSTESTGGRRPEGDSVDSGAPNTGHPSSEVPVGKKRRNLTAAYKIRVLETVKSLKAEGGTSIGSYLRTEGLYYTAVRKWEKQYERGELSGAHAKSKGKATGSLQLENKKLRRKLASTEKQLEQSKIIIDIQKKISKLLGIEQPEFDETTYELKSPNSQKKSP